MGMRKNLTRSGVAVCIVLISFVACALAFALAGGLAPAKDALREGMGAGETSGDAAPRRADNEADDEERQIAVVMYHNILKSSKGTYTVSPAQLESDLAAYAEAGYETVFPSEVVAFVSGGGSLPEKPLILTFDDGRYNNMFYGLPLFEKYDAKAAFFPVGAFSAFSTDSGDHSNPNYSHLTWAQMGELAASGRVELGSHSYNMHRYSPRFGVKRMKGETPAAYRRALAEDTGRMQDAILRATGVLPLSYAFPFGEYSDEATAVIRSFGVRVFFTCNEGVSTVRRGAPDTLLRLRRVNRDGALDSAEVTEKLGLLSKQGQNA